MSIEAACLDSRSRHRILREMGIEPMVLRTTGRDVESEAGRFLLLVPQSARDDGPQSKLVSQILAASALPEERMGVVWVQALAKTKLPSHGVCLVLGDLKLDEASGSAGALHQLPSPADLLKAPREKREVWRALRAVCRHLAMEA